MRRLEGPLGGRGGGKGKPCRQFTQMRVGSRRRKGRGMQTDAWDGARKGCGRARPQAGTRGRTWAATRRRGHRETATAMTALFWCPFNFMFVLYYLGVQRCDRHKHWRRSTATPAPSYLPLIGVELTIAECTRLAITETGPRLGAVIRRAISNQHVSWRADGGEASWEAAHLTLPLQRCGGPTR